MDNTIKILTAFDERDIHPFLVHYLGIKLKIYAKTVYHEISTKVGKGKNEWLHPDIVGFNLPVEGWNEKVLGLCEQFSINRATIYSFELKKSITTESLREQFFQAVSNSSWANEGYLVGVDIDVTNVDLIQEINRLSSAFGIGIIRLNLENCEESEILFPARRRQVLDGETMNKLFTINPNFRDFVQATIDSITINHPVADKFDSILELTKLKTIIRNRIEIKESNNELIQELPIDNDIKYINFLLKDNLTGTSPLILKINDDEFDVTTWSNLYISTCEYLINKDSERFKNICKTLRGKKVLYFSENELDIRRKYFFEKINMFAELNFSTNDIIKYLKILLTDFGIPFDSVKCMLKE